jgi:pheromone shutdown-related protein TraB
MTLSAELSDSVSHIKLDSRDIYLVGTAHVSAESVEDVSSTVGLVKPDSICVELCQGRYKTLTDRQSWKKMDVFTIVKQKKSLFLLVQLVMSAFYRKLGEKLGVKPGAEMLEGIRLTEETGAKLILADRDIQITLKRVWGYLGFWTKLKLLSHLLAGLFSNEEIDAEMIDKMKKTDQLEAIMQEFAEKFPEVKKRLIDERDIYLAEKIRQASGNTVAVVGAGHVDGIKGHIQTATDLTELEQLPPASIWPKFIKWIIPLAIVGLLVIGFLRGGLQNSVESIYIWVLVNGVLSSLGAIIALAHPLTVVAAFLAAPLTSLNPFMAAGWVAGLVQAIVAKPTVADFENLAEATSSVKGFWKNPVTRILLVVVLANLGSGIATFISGGWIAARSLGN